MEACQSGRWGCCCEFVPLQGQRFKSSPPPSPLGDTTEDKRRLNG